MRSCPLGQALVFLHVHVLEPNRGNICFTAVLTAPDLHTPTHTDGPTVVVGPAKGRVLLHKAHMH